MPATKALFFVLLLGAIVGSIVVFFFPDLRPGIVQNWMDTAAGITPADSPTQAIEKFRDCLKSRDYRGAAKYLGGDYGECFSHVTGPASKLAGSVEDLMSTIQTVGINAPDGKYVIDNMQPFPKEFDFSVTKELKGEDYRTLTVAFPKEFPSDQHKALGDKVALARITPKLLKAGDSNAGKMNTGSMDRRIFLALVPLKWKWDGFVGLKDDGDDKQKNWKIYIPLSADVNESADYLKQNYGNYTQALKNVKNEIKRDAATKSTFEAELSKELVDAK
jgi:hypothetical protein